MFGKFHTPLQMGNYFLPKSHKLAVFKEKCASKNSSLEKSTQQHVAVVGQANQGKQTKRERTTYIVGCRGVDS